MTEQEAIDMLKYRIKTATEIVGDNGAYDDLRIAIVALEKQGNLRKIASEIMKKNYQEDEYNYFQKGIQALVFALEKEE